MSFGALDLDHPLHIFEPHNRQLWDTLPNTQSLTTALRDSARRGCHTPLCLTWVVTAPWDLHHRSTCQDLVTWFVYIQSFGGISSLKKKVSKPSKFHWLIQTIRTYKYENYNHINIHISKKMHLEEMGWPPSPPWPAAKAQATDTLEAGSTSNALLSKVHPPYKAPLLWRRHLSWQTAGVAHFSFDRLELSS